jgi:hypothetical protein
MNLSRVILPVALALAAITARAQDNRFNLFLDTAASFQLDNSSGIAEGAFRARNLRVDVRGAVGEHLTYRLRQRLNASSAPGNWENFSRATDFMWIGWKFNDRFTLTVGKMCQAIGGYDYDENPLYIYQYSDLLNAMEIFYAGVQLAWYPVKDQEILFNVTNSYNYRFEQEYPGGAFLTDGTQAQASAAPLSYLLNWNGHIGPVETRWGGGVINQAVGFNNYVAFFGQKLAFPAFQVYLDIMGSAEDIDRLKIATRELGGTGYQKDVTYTSFALKSNWQFSPGWNLMTKLMYDGASVPEQRHYRNALGYAGALEYFPIKGQDLRFFLAYIGHKAWYTLDSLQDSGTGRAEIGFMYRIKAY